MENFIKSHSPLLMAPYMLMILANCPIYHEFLLASSLYKSIMIFLTLQTFSLSK